MMSREVAHRRLKLFGIGAGSLLLLASAVVVIGYLSAPNFYLTRAIFWGESDYKDLEKFLLAPSTTHLPPSASTSCARTTPTPPRSRISGTVAPTAASWVTLSRAGRRRSLSSMTTSCSTRGTSTTITRL